MMRPTRIDARGRSRDGKAILAYLKEGELSMKVPSPASALGYYVAGDEAPSPEASNGRTWNSSRWIGKGAERLGLDMGERVDMADMDKLAHGYNPKDGEALSQTAGREAKFKPKLDKKGNPLLDKNGQPKGTWAGGHRVGFDLTFSLASKGVSLAFAAADPAERVAILEAHQDAVSQALSYVETLIETGRGAQGKQKMGVAGLVASSFMHLSNRELEPQLHEHVLVYGVAPGVDGKWGGWEALQLYEHQQTIGALARAAFAQNMAGLGYGIEKKPELDARGEKTGEVYFELTGVSDETVKAFSTRRQQVLAYAEEHGTTKQQAALATRKDKEEPGFQVVDELWKEAMAKHREEEPEMFKSVDELKAQPSKLSGVEDEDLLRALQKRDAVWTKQELIGQLAREYVGQKSVEEILTEADDFLVRMEPQLVRMDPEKSADVRELRSMNVSSEQWGRKFTEARYSAQWWVEDIEQAMVDSAKRRQDEPKHAVLPASIKAAVDKFEKERGFSISEEQRAAVDHITGGEGVSLLTGRAGTGKTTIASVAVNAWKASGKTTIGCAIAWDAATKLQSETGMSEAFSAAKLLHDLDRGKVSLGAQTVVILDEAGMVDSDTARRLQEHVDNGGAKLVMMGDSWQLAPVGAGQAFRLLRDAIGDAELTEIRRQKNDEDVETAKTLYKHSNRKRNETTRAEQASLGAQVLHRLVARDQVETVDTLPEALDQLAEDYVSDPKADREKLALASTRSDVKRLNEAIRAKLKETGQVSSEEHVVGLTQEGVRVDTPLAVGDRLRFTKKSKELGVVNGSMGVVEVVEARDGGEAVLQVRLESEIKADEGRVLKFSTRDYADLSGAFSRTIHKSQGQTVSSTYYLANGGMDTHLSMVAFTRSRENFKMYVTEQDLESMEERLGLDRLRMNALEEGRFGEAKELAIPPRPAVVPAAAKARMKQPSELDATKREQVERLHVAIVARRERQQLKRKIGMGIE